MIYNGSCDQPRQLGVSLLWPQPETGDWSDEDLLWLPTDLTTASHGLHTVSRQIYVSKNQKEQFSRKVYYYQSIGFHF